MDELAAKLCSWVLPEGEKVNKQSPSAARLSGEDWCTVERGGRQRWGGLAANAAVRTERRCKDCSEGSAALPHSCSEFKPCSSPLQKLAAKLTAAKLGIAARDVTAGEKRKCLNRTMWLSYRQERASEPNKLYGWLYRRTKSWI